MRRARCPAQWSGEERGYLRSAVTRMWVVTGKTIGRRIACQLDAPLTGFAGGANAAEENAVIGVRRVSEGISTTPNSSFGRAIA